MPTMEDTVAEEIPKVTTDLIRAVFPGAELRDDDAAGGTMVGHFAVFDEWTEIDSIFEGRFLERIAPGAFAKTFQENRGGMRVLFQHGFDPVVGDKPLGTIDELEEDDQGARYEVSLLDTSYNRDIVEGLRAGVYGASFRFRVMKEEFVQKPDRSKHNPDGLPERSLTEVQVREFGPVTFPAYEGATAGVRSLTDRLVIERLVTEHPGQLRKLLEDRGTPALPDEGSRNGDRTDDVAALFQAQVAEMKEHRERTSQKRRERA